MTYKFNCLEKTLSTVITVSCLAAVTWQITADAVLNYCIFLLYWLSVNTKFTVIIL